MGMSAAGASGSGRGGRGHRRRGRHHALMSEINVTPMVDVMLVLLIIFMVAAPLLTVGVPIDELVAKLQAISKTGYDERIFIRGDKSTDYGTAMKVMARISAAGYKNIGLVSLQEQDQ